MKKYKFQKITEYSCTITDFYEVVADSKEMALELINNEVTAIDHFVDSDVDIDYDKIITQTYIKEIK